MFEVNFNVLNINVSECTDTDNGAKGEFGFGCDHYGSEGFPSFCGQWDDDDFKAHKMCCSCKNNSKCFLCFLLKDTED